MGLFGDSFRMINPEQVVNIKLPVVLIMKKSQYDFLSSEKTSTTVTKLPESELVPSHARMTIRDLK